MKIVFLDGRKIDKPADLHRAFAEDLEFPDYFGKNMDALHDCLTDIFEDVGIIAVNTDLLEENLGRSWRAFRRMIADVTEDKPNIRYLEEPFGQKTEE